MHAAGACWAVLGSAACTYRRVPAGSRVPRQMRGERYISPPPPCSLHAGPVHTPNARSSLSDPLSWPLPTPPHPIPQELVYYDMKVEQLLLQRRGDTFQANVVDLASIGNEDHVHNWSLHTIPPEAAKDTLMAGGMFERATMSDHAGKPFGRWAAALTVLEALFGVNPFWPTGKQVAAAERRIEEEEDELREEGEWPPCGYDVMDLGPWVYALLLNVAKGLSYLRAHPLWALLTADERDLFEAALHADPALRASPAQLRATAVGAAVFEGGCGVGQWEGWESRDEAELRKEGEEGWWVKKQEAAGGDEEGARASKSRGAASGRGMPGRAWRSCVGCMPGRAAHKGALVRAASAPPSFAAAASSCCALGLSSAPSAPAASESEDERECMDAVGRATSGSCEGPSASSCGSLDAHVCVLPLSASCGSSSSAISSTLNGGTSPGFDADAEATCVIRAASPLECGGFAAHAKMAACVKGTAGFEAPRTDASCACLPEGHDDAGRDEPLPLCPSSPRSISRDLHPPTPVPALAPLPSVGTCCASPSSPSGPRSGGGSCGDGASQAPAVAHVLPHGKKRRSKGERDTRTFAQRVRGAAHKADKEVSKAAVAVAKSADDAVSRLTAAASRAKAALKGMFKRVPKC